MAKHEGSHGITEDCVIRILNIKEYSSIMEGFVEALAEGTGIYKPTNISFSQLLNASYNPEENIECCYQAAPKYYFALFKKLSKNLNNDTETAWLEIIKQMIYTAFEIKSQINDKPLNDKEKTSRFFKTLIKNLNLDPKKIEKLYNNFNSF